MTRITLSDIDGDVSIILKGHACYSDHGDDVVCAGISTVTYAIANYLDMAEHRGKLREFSFKDTPGDMEIQFSVSDFPEWNEIKSFILSSYLTLAEAYPENLELIYD